MNEDVELAKQRLGSLVGDQWTLMQVLGAGGVGAVYRARGASGEFAAVKILHSTLAHRKDVKERFLREGVLANKVGHEGALKVLEHGSTADGAGYLVMELLEGETLTRLIQQDGPIGVNALFRYLDQILSVLIVAHGAGIIHRDLKPDNLFITTAGQLKVLDFGLARRLADIQGDFKTKTGLALGTIPYMAPEQALGRRAEVDGRVDLFALGAMAFRILARRRIHEADSEAEMLMRMASTPAPPLGEFAPNIPRGAQRVVDLALAFSRDARYPDAQTMQQDVRDVLANRAPRHAQARLDQLEDTTRVQPAAIPGPGGVQQVAATRPFRPHPQRTEPMPVSQPTPIVAPDVAAPVLPAPAPIPASSPGAAPRPLRRSSVKLWLATGVVVALLGMAATVALLLSLTTEPPVPPPQPVQASLAESDTPAVPAATPPRVPGLAEAGEGDATSPIAPTINPSAPAQPTPVAAMAAKTGSGSEASASTRASRTREPATAATQPKPGAKAQPPALQSSAPRAAAKATPQKPPPQRRTPLLSRPGD